jgi:hypothetical protein
VGGCEIAQVVEPKKAEVGLDVAKAEEAAAAAGAIKQECEDALAEAIPILVGRVGWGEADSWGLAV